MYKYVCGSFVAFVLSACAFEVEYDPDLVAEEAPTYIAEAQLLVVMPAAQRDFVFVGQPKTEVGELSTLSIPLGQVMQEITTHVFESCFMYGVAFTEELVPELRYIVAIEPEIREFSYGYRREPDPDVAQRFDDEPPLMITTPHIEFDLAVTAYNPAGEPILDRVYETGLVSGESYYVTNRPQDIINETFHSALQQTMQSVADDIRPHLVGQCEITDL